ncbi:MAG TPA: BTAD domain-containing putative transcriptional regulator [Ilumatobacter sp.]|nr:BTAD domain-containing putative transcriptional regulator [Ilumatobacter sp.]
MPPDSSDLALRISVLGPLRVDAAGENLTPTGDLQRKLLESLVLAHGRAVSSDALAEALWIDQLPTDHVAALHTQVFRLRKRLPMLTIDRDHGGYAIDVDPLHIDVDEFERLAAGVFAHTAEVDRIDIAIALWRGEPYPSLDTDAALAARARLDELRLRLLDERYERRSGQADPELVADLESASVLHPTRERPHLLLVRALAQQHRAVDALRVYDRFRRALGEELGIEPSPEMRAEHDAIVSGALTKPSLSSRDATPRYATPMVGRHDELRRIIALTRSTRLVTLVGVGGVGKTRLAADAAAALATEFHDGVVWCDLAASSFDDIIPAISAQLGIERSGESPIGHIQRHLAHRSLLLVLDNCEHVIDQAAAVANAIVATSDAVHVLATRRERLAIDSEFVFAVEPLGVGGPATGPAVELFVERAAAAGAEMDLGTDRALVTELCDRLGGLPLAIELAAAQLFTMDVAVIAREISRSLSVLSGSRRAVGRHRSLTAAITWSYELLSPAERRTFVALSVFRAAFDVEAAGVVLGTTESEALHALRGLAERSLLQRSGPRWHMLEPLRQFAAEQTDHDFYGVADRHAEHFVQRMEQLGALAAADDPATAMDAIDQDLVEVRAAYSHLVQAAHPEPIMRLVYALQDYSMSRPRRETMAWGGAAAALAPDDPRTPDMLSFAAYAAWGRGDSEEFAMRIREAVLLSEAVRPGLPVTANVADAVGLYHLTTGHLDESVRHFEHALTLVPMHQRLRRSEINGTLVLALAYAGSPETVRRADALLAEFSYGSGALAEVWAWYGAGEALVEIDPETSMARLQLAYDRSRECGAWFVTGVAGASLASLEVRHGSADRAVELYRALLPLWTRTTDSSVVWTAMRSVSALLHRLDRPRDAAAVLGAVLHTSDGHEVFGTDAERVESLERALKAQLGERDFEAAAHAGRGLDALELSEYVLRRLDEL